jgi:hypothetical protein
MEAGEVVSLDFYSTRHLAVVEYSTEEEALNVTNFFLCRTYFHVDNIYVYCTYVYMYIFAHISELSQ